LISTINVAGSNQVVIGPLTADYEAFEIDGYVFGAGSGPYEIHAHASTDNGASYFTAAGSYRQTGPLAWVNLSDGSPTLQVWPNPGSAAQIKVTSQVTHSTQIPAVFNIKINRPAHAGTFDRPWNIVGYGMASSLNANWSRADLYASWAPITHIRLKTNDAGNFGSGYIKLYGHR
jgi:hypothetical protein